MESFGEFFWQAAYASQGHTVVLGIRQKNVGEKNKNVIFLSYIFLSDLS